MNQTTTTQFLAQVEQDLAFYRARASECEDLIRRIRSYRGPNVATSPLGDAGPAPTEASAGSGVDEPEEVEHEERELTEIDPGVAFPIQARLRKHLRELPPQFTVKDAQMLLQQRYRRRIDPTSTAKALRRIAESGEIEILRPGKGREATIFGRIK